MPNYVDAITGKPPQLDDEALASAKAAKTVITEDAYLFRRLAELVVGPGIKPTAEALARYFSVIDPKTGKVYEVPGEKSTSAKTDNSKKVEIKLDGTEDLVDVRYGPTGVKTRLGGGLLEWEIRAGNVVPRVFFNFQQRVDANIKEYMEYVEANKPALTKLNASLTRLKRKLSEVDKIENIEQRELQRKKIKISRQQLAFFRMRTDAGNFCLKKPDNDECSSLRNDQTPRGNQRKEDQKLYAFFDTRIDARNNAINNAQTPLNNPQADDETLDAADLLLSLRGNT